MKLLSVSKYFLVVLALGVSSSALPEESKCNNAVTGKVELLPKDILETLMVAADAFCEIQKEKFTTSYKVRITGTIRSIGDQARYIDQCLKRDKCRIYENQQAVQEYLSIPNPTPKKLEAKIKDQLTRKCFISKHLSNRAVDIGTRNMPQDRIALLAKLIGDTEYYVAGKKYRPIVINRSHGTGPHLHINFEPYYFDPSSCPKDHSFTTE
ncbi:hypothetical protein [Kangiella sp. HZ709]|uniref:hypothetical protein n=1 Tax=Kangiella sp. HZ709 TaxID=2666328 RepID=UPI0012B0EB21|nr:hypothetical protein [Kangiella sp. HZ709]MRX27905.1 hypothetical protein [Kangiella sp. HZ709]